TESLPSAAGETPLCSTSRPAPLGPACQQRSTARRSSPDRSALLAGAPAPASKEHHFFLYLCYFVRLSLMTTREIRQKYLEFFAARGHKVLPRALLVPQDDPTTLFTGSGMQPLVPYLLGEEHPEGNRLVDSQTCFRAEDMDEVGDNRHTTFFEMLGNWSLGDYFKEDQLA